MFTSTDIKYSRFGIQFLKSKITSYGLHDIQQEFTENCAPLTDRYC